ncbi:MAG: exopolysaccharide biosynthesis protein [Pirellulaceae bacterium]
MNDTQLGAQAVTINPKTFEAEVASDEPERNEPNSGESSSGKGQKLSAVLEKLVEETDGKDVTIGDLLETFDGRAYGPLLLIPALFAVSPIGMIPGMSVVTGSIIFLIAAEMIFSSSGPWLPQKLRSFSIRREKLVDTVEKVKPWALWVEKGIKKRLEIMAIPPMVYLLSISCMVLAATMYPLALVPFGVAVPGSAVLFFGLGLTSRDGAVILVGYVLAAAAIGLTIWAL